MCVCVRARAPRHVGLCTCVHACSLNYPACNTRALCCHLWLLSALYFSTLSHKRQDFQKKVTEHKMFVLIFSTISIRNISHSKKNSTRYCQKCDSDFHETWIFSTHFRNNSNVTCYQNPSSGRRVVPCGQTDRQTRMKKLIVAFRNFASVPEKTILFAYSVREICPYHTCVAFAHLLLWEYVVVNANFWCL